LLEEEWTREWAAGGFWRGEKTVDVNLVEPAACGRKDKKRRNLEQKKEG